MVTARDVVQKLWSYCSVLRDDGLSYPDYVEQLTYLLFLKMVDESADGGMGAMRLPEHYGWRSLVGLDSGELADHYDSILQELGQQGGMLGTIFDGAQNKIQDPAKLSLLVRDLIGGQDWSSLDFDVKGAVYEGLLEKNAQDTKSGAGQYFTPRPVVDAVVACLQPKINETVCDPACGTAGFLIAAHKYMSTTGPKLSAAQRKRLRLSTFYGADIVREVTRLAAMNLFLHGIGPVADEAEVPIQVQDSLTTAPDRSYDVILTNPPFGSRSSVKIIAGDQDGAVRGAREMGRKDFWVSTSNKELNFLQHVAATLAPGGRAAVVIPDGVLGSAGAGTRVREHLLRNYEVHTLLRLPPGLFYAQGVNANVLFFDRPSKNAKQRHDENLWVYSLRGGQRFSLTGRRFDRADIAEFERLFLPGERQARVATWTATSPAGRWRTFSVADVLSSRDKSLDLTWDLSEPTSTDAEPSSADLLHSVVADLERALEQTKLLLEAGQARGAASS